jgi:DNA-binding helix-hairpin-helix protein with protein kinase domain
MDMAHLTKGTKIKLANGGEIELVAKLGDGGQGIVYKVNYAGGEYALKWYKPAYLKDLDDRHENGKKFFKENIEKNIAKGSPNDKFLWPDAVTEEIDGCFGYIMKLRPKEYSEFTDIYNTHDKDGNRVGFTSFRVQTESALDIVNAFGALHRKGYFYLDLNDGNFFINTQTGDVLICDNDNVTAAPQYNLGKPGYIAPELVRGAKGAKSDALTDAHSLAVVLFRLFIHHDPLMGKAYCASVCVTAEKERELYGEKPVFIFDPDDNSNRPVLNVHTNPIKLWPMFPSYFQEAFITAFRDGMKDPNRRLPEAEWSKVLLRLRDDIVTCSCGTDSLWSEESGINCPKCGKRLAAPCRIEYNGYQIKLVPGNHIYNVHLNDKFTDNGVYATVVANKQDPNKWGLKNLSNDLWNVHKPNGETLTTPKDKVVSVLPDTVIEVPGGNKLVISQ